MRAMIASTLALSLAACSTSTPDADSTPAPSAQASASQAPKEATTPVRVAPREVKEENDLYDFTYSYPAAAAGIAPLNAWLESDLEKQKAALIANARDGQAAAKQGGYPYHAYEAAWDWQVATDLPGWLSLSSEVYSYTGGAHPNHWFDALLWDKATGTRRAASDLFTSPAALSMAIRKPFCALLDKERAKRRGAPIKPGSTEMFDECIDPVKEIVILGSSNHRTFNRIGVLVPPYDAGPYVEGSYDITLPVTDAVLGAVKPEYRASFSAGH